MGCPDGENDPIRLLLNMRGGLFNYKDADFNRIPGRDLEAEWTPQDLLDLALSPPVHFARAEGYHHEHQHVLLGLIAEVGRQAPCRSKLEDRFHAPGADRQQFPAQRHQRSSDLPARLRSAPTWR